MMPFCKVIKLVTIFRIGIKVDNTKNAHQEQAICAYVDRQGKYISKKSPCHIMSPIFEWLIAHANTTSINIMVIQYQMYRELMVRDADDPEHLSLRSNCKYCIIIYAMLVVCLPLFNIASWFRKPCLSTTLSR